MSRQMVPMVGEGMLDHDVLTWVPMGEDVECSAEGISSRKFENMSSVKWQHMECVTEFRDLKVKCEKESKLPSLQGWGPGSTIMELGKPRGLLLPP